MNRRTALTKKARKRSIFFGYNGGHVLPGVLPQGVDVTSDQCSEKLAGGDFSDLAVRFFDDKLEGRDTGLRGWCKVHLATQDSACTTRRNSRPTTADEMGTVASSPATLVAPPLDAKLVQKNVLPINEPVPVQGVRRRATLPAVAVDVPEGQNLYLLVSPTSDTFGG